MGKQAVLLEFSPLFADNQMKISFRGGTQTEGTHSMPCTKPHMMMAGKAGRHADIRLSFLEERSHLPILTIKRE